MTRTTDRIQTVTLELTKDKDAASKEMIGYFVGRVSPHCSLTSF